MRKTGFHPFQLWLAGTTLAVGLAAFMIIPKMVQKEKFGQLSEMTSKNAVLSRLWLESQLGEWKAMMRAARRSHMAGGAEAGAPVDFQEFTGFVALTQVGTEPWQVAWSEKTPAFEFGNLLADTSFVQEAVAGLRSSPERAPDLTGKASFQWIPNGSKAVAITLLETPLITTDGLKKTNVALVGFLPLSAFDNATRFFRGGASELSIITKSGIVLAHNDRSIVGDMIPTSSLSDRLLRGKDDSFEGVLADNTKEKVQVAFESIGESNLMVVSQTPILAVARSVQMIKLILLGLFGGLICAVLLVGRAFAEGVRRRIHHLIEVTSQPSSDRAQKLKDRLAKDEDWSRLLSLTENSTQAPTDTAGSSEAKFSSDVAPTPAQPSPAETPSAKVELESLELAGQYISQCLKEPIAASIGHLKLAKGKTAELEAAKHLEHVESEVRRIKDLIEKVQKLGVYKALQTRPADVSALVRDLMDDISIMAETVGVKIRKSLYPVPKARIATQDFREAIKVLIQERVLASQAQGKGELVVGVEPSGSQVLIRIEDRCTKLSQEERESFFRPLAQSGNYDHQHQKMLAILNYHDLKIRFDAETAEGNLLIVELPAVEEAMIESAPPIPATAQNLADSDTLESGVWKLSQLQSRAESRGDTRQESTLEAIRSLPASLDFLENKSGESSVEGKSPEAEQSVPSKESEAPRVQETPEIVISGPLSEYSVKVRKPRLNVPLE